ncbi:MAG TPA: hypothetical protein VMS17_12825 [Gemmataceae bacterium]|nr:hypothetical protein [Gemmataceae bacterium]
MFRTDGRLQFGDRVRFAVSVLGEAVMPCPGGTLWTCHESLAAARFMEAFLDGTPPDCQVALWQTKIVDAPSDAPRIDVEAENT